MYRVTFDDGGDGGTLACPRCGKSYEFDLGRDAMHVIFSHFYPDRNASIPACPTVRWQIGETSWEAVDSDGNLTARGVVIIQQVGNAIQSPEVRQHWPER
jgi:hypothetical protein